MTAHAYALVDAFIFGSALQEANLPATGGADMTEVAEAIAEQFADGQYPHLTELTVEHVLKCSNRQRRLDPIGPVEPVF